MNVGSLFTGIGGFDLGLERAGHRILFQCEKDPYRRRVLARHWPGVPCFPDVREIAQGNGHRRPGEVVGNGSGSDAERLRPGGQAGDGADRIDLLCGGFPCQDLSVAGKRAGLSGERSGLFFEFARIADALLTDGGWVLIENVPGLLSSHGGRDFAVLLATLAQLGFHDLAWRVLDSRYLGVPQRRRRVFILARRSRGRRSSEVLLEPESGGGDFEASRETGQTVAASLSKGSANPGVSYPGRRQEDDENLHYYIEDFEDGTLTAAGDGTNAPPRSDRKPLLVGEAPDPNGVREAPGLPGRAYGDPMMFDASSTHGGEDTGSGKPNMAAPGESLGLTSRSDRYSVTGGGPAREVCALDPKPDGPRYAACGDAVTVNVAEWIGRRLHD